MKTKGAFNSGGFFSDLVQFGAGVYASEQQRRQASAQAERDAEVRRAEIEANAENVALTSQRNLVRNIALAGVVGVGLLVWLRSSS